MGTLLAVTQPAGPERHHLDIAGVAFSIARRCELIMNRHDPNSELGRLNRSAGSATGVRARELARVLRAAQALSRRVDGAFDPTAGALIDLWRDASSSRGVPGGVPGAVVGAGALRIAGDRVALPRRGSVVDLDAFAKGLALDRIAARLRRSRATAFLNFGESSLLAVGGPRADRWPVLLRDPFAGFAGEFDLRGRACSTSATLGGRGAAGVVVDPRTGRRVTRAAQVTVLARSAAVAEVVSTALLVLGRGAVDDIAARMAVDICWIDRSGTYTTARFALRRVA
jgi:thiamine biosynthesis lipoprotein